MGGDADNPLARKRKKDVMGKQQGKNPIDVHSMAQSTQSHLKPEKQKKGKKQHEREVWTPEKKSKVTRFSPSMDQGSYNPGRKG